MSTSPRLTAPAAVALYVGALVGPSLLLLPGVVVATAGPASVLVWVGLLCLSALLAWIFAALGARLPSSGGTADYATAAFGPRLGAVVRWWFVGGVVLGAPLVCYIGAGYLNGLLGGDRWSTLGLAAALLAAVMIVTGRGRALGGSVQLVLVAVLVGVVVLAVVTAAPHADGGHWRPFAPHGWSSVATAAAPLMLCFVGWEAIAPMVGRLAHPARTLPRVAAAAWAITALLYLSLAVATVAVLGDAVGLAPLADLLGVALGVAGRVLAAVIAVVVTLAATNAYLSGAGQMLAEQGVGRLPLQLSIAGAGVLIFGGLALGLPIGLVLTVPTAAFVAVYVVSCAAAVRLLRGPVRVAAAAATAITAVVLLSTGWTLLLVAAIGAVALVASSRDAPKCPRMSAPGCVLVP